MNRPSNHLVPLLYTALACGGLLFAVVGGSNAAVVAVGLTIAAVAGTTGGIAWRRAAPVGRTVSTRGWWKLVVAGPAIIGAVIVAAGLGSRRTRSSACSPSWSPSWSPGSVCCWASSVSSDGVHERCRHHIATARRRRVRSLLRRRTARSAGHVGPVIRVHPRRLSTTNLVRSAGAPPSSHAAAGAADARRRGGRWVHARRHRSRLDAPDLGGPGVHVVARHDLHRRRLHDLRPRPVDRRRGPQPSSPPVAVDDRSNYRCGRDACALRRRRSVDDADGRRMRTGDRPHGMAVDHQGPVPGRGGSPGAVRRPRPSRLVRLVAAHARRVGRHVHDLHVDRLGH